MPSASDVWWYPTNMHRHWPLWYLHVLFGVWWWVRDVEPQVWQIPRTLERWDYLEGTSGKFWMEAHFREWRQVPGGRLPAGYQGSWKCWYVLDAHNGQVHEGNLIPGKFYSRFRIILNCFIWLFCKWALFIHDTHTPTKTSNKACWFLNQSNHQGSWSNAFPRAWRPVNVFSFNSVTMLSPFGVIGKRTRFIRIACFFCFVFHNYQSFKKILLTSTLITQFS